MDAGHPAEHLIRQTSRESVSAFRSRRAPRENPRWRRQGALPLSDLDRKKSNAMFFGKNEKNERKHETVVRWIEHVDTRRTGTAVPAHLNSR